jgi:hypothetical protein
MYYLTHPISLALGHEVATLKRYMGKGLLAALIQWKNFM